MRQRIERLTFVTDGPYFGGAERYIIAMAGAARRRGIDPHIYWMRTSADDVKVFDASRIGQIRLTATDPAKTRNIRGLIGEFRTMIQSHRPDALVINASGRPRFWLHCWLAWQASLPAVWVHHMVDGRDHRRSEPRWLNDRLEGPQWWRVRQTVRHRLAATTATAVVTSNEDDRDSVARWHGLRPEHIWLIPPGIDYEHFRFDPEAREKLLASWGVCGSYSSPSSVESLNGFARRFVVGTAGRLVHEKRMDLLIEAVARMNKRGVPVLAVIAGQGPLRDTLERLAKQHNLTDTVKFVEFVENMPAFYSALDAFVLCSETESFGLVLTEAMACGCPIVGTPTAGARHQIDHLHNGWQIMSWDPIELSEALTSILCSPTLRPRMSGWSRINPTRKSSIDTTLELTLLALRGNTLKRSGLCRPAIGDAPFINMPAEDCT